MKLLLIISLFVFIFTNQTQNPKLRLIEFTNGTRVWVHQDTLSKYVPTGLINYADVTETPDLEKGEVEKVLFPDRVTQQATIRPMLIKIDSGHSEDHVRSVTTHLSTYRTRHAQTATGVEAVQWLKAEYEKRINQLTPERKALFTVRVFQHSGWLQPSLIVTMKGKTDQIVILGGHIDSTASGGIAPGADDDASGSASVLEAFTIIAVYSNYVPTKTVEFHAYAAEEMGLLGSRAIVQEYKNQNKRVYGMCQLDMDGYNPNNSNRIGVITNGVNAALTEFSRKLITAYCRIPFINRTLFGGSSDHASWISGGYAAIFPFEAVTNPHIHTIRDTVDKLDFKNAIEWVKLGVSFIVELSHD